MDTFGGLKRLASRFGLCYLILYNLPFPLDKLPRFGWKIGLAYRRAWSPLVFWSARNLFGISQPFEWRPGPSGDTTYAYLMAWCMAVAAALAAFALTARPPRLEREKKLVAAARAYVRFALAAALISYGAYKVIPTQFAAPSADRLLKPIGEASPMGLLWTFMGASAPYTIFTGAAELLAGLLLTWRRTARAGAFLALAVMSHVVMLNLCYDVPVKLFAMHLLAMAAFVAAPEARRALDFLLERQPAPPAHRLAPALTAVLVVLYTVQALSSSYGAWTSRGDGAAKPELYGVWAVADLRWDGRRPTTGAPTLFWRRVVFTNSRPRMAILHYFNGSKAVWDASVDSARGELSLESQRPREDPVTLRYRKLEPGSLELSGTWQGRPLVAILRREEFPLLERGFHWISEQPYNR